MQDARLVHIIDISPNDGRVLELLTYHCEPLHHFVVNVVIMPGPIHHPYSLRFKFWVMLGEGLRPIFTWRSNVVVRGKDLKRTRTETCNHENKEIDRQRAAMFRHM